MDHWSLPALRRARLSSMGDALSILVKHGHQLSSLELPIELLVDHPLNTQLEGPKLRSFFLAVYHHSPATPNLQHEGLETIRLLGVDLEKLGCCKFKSVLASIERSNFPCLTRIGLNGAQARSTEEEDKLVRLPVWFRSMIERWNLEGIRLELSNEGGGKLLY